MDLCLFCVDSCFEGGVVLSLGVCGLLFAIRHCRAWILLLIVVFCCLS